MQSDAAAATTIRIGSPPPAPPRAHSQPRPFNAIDKAAALTWMLLAGLAIVLIVYAG